MEQIYTIPVHEAFEAGVRGDEGASCPFCRLHNRLENQELDRILGAAMMEPDVRIDTNRYGFCDVHFARLLGHGKRLSLALMLESHMDEVLKRSPDAGLMPGAAGKDAVRKLGEVTETCYLCGRIGTTFRAMVETAALLWEKEEAFRSLCLGQKQYCLPHYVAFLRAAKERLSGRDFAAFYKAISAKENETIETLGDEVSWFCKKFDYRYENEPWNGCKDAPERAILFLTGDLHREEEKA
ncbi:MAG: DUF6062 family protein [Clostridia bacterium]|nr:DUF6062 family protein [Clostridia bacterium]